MGFFKQLYRIVTLKTHNFKPIKLWENLGSYNKTIEGKGRVVIILKTKKN